MSPRYQGIHANSVAYEFVQKIGDIERNDEENTWRGPDDYFTKRNAQRIHALQERIKHVAFP